MELPPLPTKRKRSSASPLPLSSVDAIDLSLLEALEQAQQHNPVETLDLKKLDLSAPSIPSLLFSTMIIRTSPIDVVTELVCEKTKLLKWLQARIKVREFDSNKQYGSEILAILLQNSVTNQKRFGGMNGDGHIVAGYKSKDPKMGDEEEMVENLFDCLCCLLMPLYNKERFVKAEGVELMIIIMNQKKSCYGSAIRAPLRIILLPVSGLLMSWVKRLLFLLLWIPLNKKNKKRRYK